MFTSGRIVVSDMVNTLINEIETESDRDFFEGVSEQIFEYFVNKKCEKSDQNKEKVKQLVSSCLDHHANSEKAKKIAKKCFDQAKTGVDSLLLDNEPQNEDLRGLGEIVFGICDGDNSKNPKRTNVFFTSQYSYENFVLNPVNLYVVLKHLDPDDPTVKYIEQEEPKLKTASNEQLFNDPRLLQHIIDSVTLRFEACANSCLKQFFDKSELTDDGKRKGS
jgi:hypothetical protein